jgi:ABC-type enterochelin transport system permease subunit
MAKLVIWAGVLYAILQTGKGRNWARWLLVGLVIVTIPLNLLPLIPAFTDYPIDGSLGVLQYALFFIALGLLFHPNASAWFGKGTGSTRS